MTKIMEKTDVALICRRGDRMQSDAGKNGMALIVEKTKFGKVNMPSFLNTHIPPSLPPSLNFSKLSLPPSSRYFLFKSQILFNICLIFSPFLYHNKYITYYIKIIFFLFIKLVFWKMVRPLTYFDFGLDAANLEKHEIEIESNLILLPKLQLK